MTSTSDSGGEPLYLSGIEVTDVLRLRHVELKMDGPGVTVVSGDNGEGKTSLLRAIRMALGGEGEVPTCPIRIGAEQGDVIVLVAKSDGSPVFRIHRKLRAGGSYLELTDARGDKVRRPAETLRDLCNLVTFNPVAFAEPPGCSTEEQRRKARREMLLSVSQVGIDLTAAREELHAAEQERLARTRACQQHITSGRVSVGVDGRPVMPEPPATGTPPTQAEIDSARRDLEAATADERDQIEIRARIEQAQREITDLRERLAAAEQRLAAAQRAQRVGVRLSVADARRRFDEVMTRVPDQAAAARYATAKANVDLYISDLEARAEADRRVQDCRANIQRALSEAKYPTPAVAVTPDGDVVLRRKDGSTVPFDQASQAQRLVLSFVVMAALRPHLRLALIEDGNGLDQKTMAMLAKIATERGYRIVLERVARDQPGAIVIEDGEVAQ